MSRSDGGGERARRGRPPKISQHQIVEAALGLGLDSFSMQGIADRLGVTPPALYSHVAGREQVLALVNGALLSHMRAFSSSATDWRGWFTDFAHDVREHLAPSGSTLIDDMRSPAAAVRVGIGERGLQLLLDSGFTPAEAGYAMWLVFRLAITVGTERDVSLATYVDQTATVLRPEVSTQLPATQLVHESFLTADPAESFAFELQVVLDGLSEWVAAKLDDRSADVQA